MRPPGWLVLSNAGIDGDGNYLLDVRVRRWHPGFWLFAAETVLRAIIGRPRYVSS